jgi:6-phosphogluconolactonase/glucosamine-6-phosphate isomerase/deaminase
VPPAPRPDTEAAATLLREAMQRALEARGRFDAVLCGGRTALETLRALHRLPGSAALGWPQTHWFALDDGWDASTLDALHTLPLARAQLLRPRAGACAIDAAREYEQALRAHFSLKPGELPRFDFALLSADERGRIAGFEPPRGGSVEMTRLVVVHARGTPALALALPVLDAARCTVLVDASADHAPLLQSRPGLHVFAASTARSSG